MARGWRVGELLGTEAELLERHGVSRAVFREAVRLVEHVGLAHTRRGPGGGLVVAEPQVQMVIDAVTVALLHSGVGWVALYEARTAVEQATIEIAVAAATPDDVALLKAVAERGRVSNRGEGVGGDSLHQRIAEVSRNPAAILFTEILGRLVHQYSKAVNAESKPSRSVLAEYHDAHDALVAAIEARDVALASRRMGVHLQAQAAWTGRNRRADAVRPETVALSGAQGPDKLAEVVARKLLTRVVALGWPTGQVLGSETDLMDEFGISRAVFRESVRLLEHHGVGRMRRGPGGGLVVTAPNVGSVAESASIYLAYRNLRIEHLMDMRRALEIRTLRMATERADAAGLARLRAICERETHVEFAPETDEVFHVALADLSGNPVLALFTNVLTVLTSLHANRSRALDPEAQEAMRIDVQHAHHRIVDAMEEVNLGTAERRLRVHLDAMEPWLSP